MDRIYIFQDLDASEIRQVSLLMQSRKFGPGEVIYKEGDKGGALNIIVRGKVCINKTMVEGDQFCIATLKEGEEFGILSFMDGASHDAGIISEDNTELMILGRGDFDKLALSHPDIAVRMLRKIALHLASIVRNMNSKQMDLMHLMFRKSK